MGKNQVCIKRRGKANFGALKQKPICKQSRGVECIDKLKWNIPSDATEKEPRDRARVRGLLTHCAPATGIAQSREKMGICISGNK